MTARVIPLLLSSQLVTIMTNLVPFPSRKLSRPSAPTWLELIGPNSAPDPRRDVEILSAIHGTRLAVALQVRIEASRLAVGVKAHPFHLRTLTAAISGASPDVAIVPSQPPPRRGPHICVGWYERTVFWAPLRSLGRTESSDALHALCEAVQPLQATEQVLVHFLVRPASRQLKLAIYEAITEETPPKSQIETLARLLNSDLAAPRRPRFEAGRYRPMEERLRQPAFEVFPIVAVAGADRRRLYAKMRRLENVFRSVPNAGFGGFRLGPWGWGASPRTLPTAWPPGVTGHYLTTGELGVLWHPASSQVRAPGVSYLKQSNQPLPIAVARARGLVIGRHQQPGSERFVRIPVADLRAGPTLVCGKTGMGKSVWLRQLIAQLSALPGRPTIIVVDPHNLALTTVLDSVPAEREPDTFFFDCADTDHPFTVNPLMAPPGVAAEIHSQHVFALISSLFTDVALHPRMQDALYAGLATLCAQPVASLLDLERLYLDAAFRQRALTRVADPVIVAFWQRYDRLSAANQLERTEPILYRVRALSRSPAVRNLTCQRRPFDLTTLIDRGSLLLFGLAGEAIKAEARTLGNLVISGLHMALTARLNRPSTGLRPVYLIVDEAHLFHAASLIALHSEARKTNLAVISATQYLDKWSADMVQAEDAQRLRALIAPFAPQDVLTLDRFEALASFHVDNQAQPAIDIRTIPIDRPEDHGRLDRIREQTRRRFCRPRGEVEAELLVDFAPLPAQPMPSSPSLPPLWQRQDIDEE
jgi:hypothetical protein